MATILITLSDAPLESPLAKSDSLEFLPLSPATLLNFSEVDSSELVILEPDAEEFYIELKTTAYPWLDDAPLVILASEEKTGKALSEKLGASAWLLESELHAHSTKLLLNQMIALGQGTSLQDLFVSRVSHELKTPLNAIIGFSDLGIHCDNTDDPTELFTMIHNAGESMLLLVDDLLDFSRLQAGKLSLRQDEFDLYSWLESEIKKPRLSAERKGLQFITDVTEESFGRYRSDFKKLSKVFRSLVTNAVKYTDEGSITIRVSVDSQSESGDPSKQTWLLFEIQDTGRGITDAHQLEQGKIFHENESAYEGIGVGLSLSTQFLELLGGALWIDSTPKKGSTFSFVVPLEKLD